MTFTPPLPTTNGVTPYELIALAEQVWINSAKLTSTYSPALLGSIRELLRKVNSYYSNRIESEGTHPIDIERAMKKDFDSDEKKRNLQQLSLVYIEVQKHIEALCQRDDFKPFSKDFILSVHKEFYSKDEMQAFCIVPKNAEWTESTLMIAGEMRGEEVAIREHIAPLATELDSLFVSYENFYNKDLSKIPQAQKLIYAIVAHHRLTWIHPFLDGNGRTSRLVLDGSICHIGLEGYGLWNISRGLARDATGYKKYLSYADQKRQGDRDGRGQLSLKGLELYVKFMLETALDQINFMNNVLQLNTLSSRITQYVELSRKGMYSIEALPKYSEYLLKELLIRGELPRGEVKNIISAGDTTARNLTKKLLELEYIESDSPKGYVRLKFNSYFASKIFPDLIPPKE